MLWTILIGIALLIGLLVIALIAFVVYATIKDSRKDLRVRQEGRPILASLMMANRAMYDPDGWPQAPGVVVFGFYGPNPKLKTTLREIAERCYALYAADDPFALSPVCRDFSLLLKNHRYHEGRRNRVPAEVAGAAAVYVADLWIMRERLSEDWQDHRAVVCAVTGTDQGEITMLPLDDPTAQQIYATAGVRVSAPVAQVQPTRPAMHTRQRPSPEPPQRTLAPATRRSSGVPAFVWFMIAGGALLGLVAVGGVMLIKAALSSLPKREPEPVAVAPTVDEPQIPSPQTTNALPVPTSPILPPREIPAPSIRESSRPEPVETPVRPANTPTGSGFAPADRPILPKTPSPFDSGQPEASSLDQLRMPFQNQDEITFGPIGCPVVVVGKNVWHIEQRRIVQQLQNEYNTRGLKALSGDGQWFATASKSPNQQDTSIGIWNTVTGDRTCEIPGQAESFADLIRFSRNKYLLVGGRHSSEIDVWDVQSGNRLKAIATPARRIDPGQIAWTADGQYFTSIVDDDLTVVETKTGKTAAIMESPPPILDPQRRWNDVQRRIAARQVIANTKLVAFSPDGRELAAVSDLRNPRLVCWDSRGKLIFDQTIPRVQHAFFFDPIFDWLPDGSGWIISGHVLDRATQRIVFAVRPKFGDDPLFFPLDRNRLLGAPPHEPKTLQVIEIPWDQINASLKLLDERAPALLAPFEPVSVELQLSGLRGDQRETEEMLVETLSKRLQAEGLQVAAGRSTAFRLRFSEQAGDSRPIFERQSPLDFRGRATGQNVTEAEGSLVVELVADGEILWRDTIRASLSRSLREEINDATLRQSMLENLARQMNRLNLPYFVPVSRDHLALPVIIE